MFPKTLASRPETELATIRQKCLLLAVVGILLAGCGSAATNHPTTGGTGSPRSGTGVKTVTTQGSLAGLRVTGAVNAAFSSLPTSAKTLRLGNVTFVSPQDGWATGSRCGGTPRRCQSELLSTTNGGGKWAKEAYPGGAVTFLDARFGWDTGKSGLYTSDDGGKTWSRLTLPAGVGSGAPGSPGFSVSFANPQDGWLLTAGGNCATDGQCGASLYRTSDGGGSWNLAAQTSFTSSPGASPGTLALGTYGLGGYFGNGVGWLLSQRPMAQVLTTSDGGNRWHVSAYPGGGGGGPAYAALTPGKTGWFAGMECLGMSGCANPVLATTDGGSSWRRLAGLSGFLTGLTAARDGKSAWLVEGAPPGTATCGEGNCPSTLSIVSPTGSLGAAQPAGRWFLNRVAPLNSQEAWAIGTDSTDPAGTQAILHTTDGGRVWRVQFQAAAVAVPAGALGFWNSRDGWALGTSNMPLALLRTNDGGRTWTKTGRIPLTAGGTINGVAFPDPTHGWVEEDPHRLLATVDGGGNWRRVQFRGNYAFANLQGFGFTGSSQGWALGMVGADVTQKAYQCKGQAVARPGQGGHGGLSACLPFFQPLLYRTGDGGQTWTPLPAPSGVHFDSMGFGSALVGWAVAQIWGQAPPGQTVLLATKDGGKNWQRLATLSPTTGESFLPQIQALAAGTKGVWLVAGSTLYGSADGGKTWTQVNLPPGAGAASEVQADFLSLSRGWLKTGGGLYRTTDGGKRWAQLQAF